MIAATTANTSLQIKREDRSGNPKPEQPSRFIIIRRTNEVLGEVYQ